MARSSSKTAARPALPARLAALRELYGPPPPPVARDPYHLLLLEQVAYLAEDDVRLAAFAELRRTVGLAPAEILAATPEALRRVARLGGAIAVAERAERLRAVAERIVLEWEGDLAPLLARPFAEARRELGRFPAIGQPGAERILLFTGAQPVLALDSNGLRALVRLGYGREVPSYARTYRSAQEAAERELPETVAARLEAHLLLRRHGQELCRRNHPACERCPLRSGCPYPG
ncbi:MAG TPA: hypothetical protein VN783_07480 [Thermoanaerobaculia bacterium]|nr:hypothetical protein [Thermoanaerobaculia bacterium]